MPSEATMPARPVRNDRKYARRRGTRSAWPKRRGPAMGAALSHAIKSFLGVRCPIPRPRIQASSRALRWRSRCSSASWAVRSSHSACSACRAAVLPRRSPSHRSNRPRSYTLRRRSQRCNCSACCSARRALWTFSGRHRRVYRCAGGSSGARRARPVQRRAGRRTCARAHPDRGRRAAVTVPSGFSASEMRLLGQVAGTAPFRGVLKHAGWRATEIEFPSSVTVTTCTCWRRRRWSCERAQLCSGRHRSRHDALRCRQRGSRA